MLQVARRLPFLSIFIGFVLACALFSLVNQSFISNAHYVRLGYYGNNKVDAFVAENAENATAVSYDDRELYDKVRVLCWVLTSPEHHATKAKTIKETWGKRCNVLLFMSTGEDKELPTVNLAVHEGRNQLWGKTREAFRYAWNNYHDKVDWFLKADDDTYVIVENLRYFLTGFNTSMPYWFGHKFKSIVKQGYFSGGAGYVLSKEAARRFVEVGYFNALICRHDHEGAEDAEMGKCMNQLNVSSMDTRDSKGRGRFFPFIPEHFLKRGKVFKGYWYWDNLYYPPHEDGLACCSDSAISFHYVTPEQMVLMEYLIYQLRPYGLTAENRPVTPEPPPDFNLTATPWVLQEETTTTSAKPNTTVLTSEVANKTA